jgi:sortase A
MKSALQWPLAAVLVTAAFFCIKACWIPAKAVLAQYLLEQAWARTLQGETDARPWPWADTTPVGVLEIPRLGVRQIVLAGASGRNLAFGPAMVTGSLQGDVLLSGHRDTHFSFLESINEEDLLRLTSTSGVEEYRVSWLEVIDSRRVELVLEPGMRRLTLLTCFPFDAIAPGGPLRYVVTARPVGLPQDWQD